MRNGEEARVRAVRFDSLVRGKYAARIAVPTPPLYGLTSEEVPSGVQNPDRLVWAVGVTDPEGRESRIHVAGDFVCRA
jgi:hypothetical protein